MPYATAYSLEESASVLRLHRATLLYWAETFREELGLPRADCDSVRFEEHHLRAIVGIHRMIVKERRTLEDVRDWIAKVLGRYGDSTTVSVNDNSRRAMLQSILEANNGVVVNAPAGIEMERQGAEPVKAQPVQKEEAGTEVDAISRRITALNESVDDLVEENRALQELIGRLIQYVEKSRDDRKDVDRTHGQGEFQLETEHTSLKAPLDQAESRRTHRNGSPSMGTRAISPGTGPSRPRLTLAERRAEIIAQREAERARRHGTETGIPLRSLSGPSSAAGDEMQTEEAYIDPRVPKPWRPRELTSEEKAAVTRVRGRD